MYRIEIVEVTKQLTHGTEYQRVADTGNPRDGGPVYEYVPCEKLTSSPRTLLLQETEELDLPAVIRAINRLG